MNAALIFSVLVLLGAFYPDHNYNYFVFLKWVVFGTSAWAAVGVAQGQNKVLTWIFITSAIIHNPIMKFRFQRETWLWIDGLTALLMVVGLIANKHRYTPHQ
jgi:uncharacterized membrane protein